MTDNVNHPAHYETGKFECIEVMLETQGVEAVLNFCQCNAFFQVPVSCQAEEWSRGHEESRLVSEQIYRIEGGS